MTSFADTLFLNEDCGGVRHAEDNMQTTQDWMPNAAYLYTLALDRPAIAWEHLRRNPDYRNDWLRFGARPRSSSSGRALKWGLRFL